MNKVVTAVSDILSRPIATNAIKFLLSIFVLLESQQSQKFSFFYQSALFRNWYF